MADGCRKCGAPVPKPAAGKGGRPRVYCTTCSPPGRRDRWARPTPPYSVVLMPAQTEDGMLTAPSVPEVVPKPVDLASRRRKAEAAEPPPRRRDEPRDDEPQASAAATAARAVLDATQKALDEAQAADSAEGALALHLAGLLAAGGYTASGAAALAKALREAMTEALKSRPTADALDELVRKRRDRLRGAV